MRMVRMPRIRQEALERIVSILLSIVIAVALIALAFGVKEGWIADREIARIFTN